MKSFRKSGITIVFVSHAMEDIKMICDRAIWIEDHNIKMEGPPSDVADMYSRNG